MPRTMISIPIPPDWKAALETEAAKRQVRPAELARLALAELLGAAGYKLGDPPQLGGARPGSGPKPKTKPAAKKTTRRKPSR